MRSLLLGLLLSTTLCLGIEYKIAAKDAEFQHHNANIAAKTQKAQIRSLVSPSSERIVGGNKTKRKGDLLCSGNAIKGRFKDETQEAKYATCTVDSQKDQTDAAHLFVLPNFVVLWDQAKYD